MAKKLTKDERQTLACNAIRARLQSIAILAVEAQDKIGSLDECMDLVDSIQTDAMFAMDTLNAIAMDKV